MTVEEAVFTWQLARGYQVLLSLRYILRLEVSVLGGMSDASYVKETVKGASNEERIAVTSVKDNR